MSSKKTALTVALGTAFAAALAGAPAASANPFGMQSLEQGYMVADASDKAASSDKPAPAKKTKHAKKKKAKTKEASCSEGSCGDSMKKKSDKTNTDEAPAPETKTM